MGLPILHRILVPAVIASLVASMPAMAAPDATPAVRGAAAAECLPLLNWQQARVDHTGNLWVLAEQGAAILRLSRDGRPMERVEVPGVRAFDADAEWGIVALDRHGHELLWWRPPSTESVAHPLPWVAGHVAWIDADTVAISTTAASDAVVLVELNEGRVVSVLLGGEQEIRPEPGATLLRSFVLAPDHARQRLYVLDSLTARLRVVSFDGRPLGEAQAAAHRLPEILDWLGKVDRDARRAGTIQTPFYLVLRAALGPAGDPWVVEHCNESRDLTTVAVIADGAIERRQLRLPGSYCSLNFALWGDQVVFAPPGSPVSWQCHNPWRRTRDDQPEGG